MSDEDEVKRLQRLRDKQVGARDARAKADRKRAKVMQSRPRAQLSLSQELKNMPAKYMWPFPGAIIGFLMGVFIGWLAQATFGINATEIVALLVAFMGALIGFMLGRIRDEGHEGWR